MLRVGGLGVEADVKAVAVREGVLARGRGVEGALVGEDARVDSMASGMRDFDLRGIGISAEVEAFAERDGVLARGRGVDGAFVGEDARLGSVASRTRDFDLERAAGGESSFVKSITGGGIERRNFGVARTRGGGASSMTHAASSSSESSSGIVKGVSSRGTGMRGRGGDFGFNAGWSFPDSSPLPSNGSS